MTPTSTEADRVLKEELESSAAKARTVSEENAVVITAGPDHSGRTGHHGQNARTNVGLDIALGDHKSHAKAIQLSTKGVRDADNKATRRQLLHTKFTILLPDTPRSHLRNQLSVTSKLRLGVNGRNGQHVKDIIA